jgi:signal transduction histidine kinase
MRAARPPASPGAERDGGRSAERGWGSGTAWLIALAFLAVLAVNVAGAWGIALARQGVLEGAGRLFELETAAQSRLLQSVLATTRADLAFLAGAPAFVRIEEELASAEGESWRRQTLESALLIFMRGHPDVTRIVLRSGGGAPLLATVRRGGVPQVTLASHDGREPFDDPASKLEPGRLSGLFTIRSSATAGLAAPRLEASIEAADLLAVGRGDESERVCWLQDRDGRLLGSSRAREDAARPASPDEARSRQWLFAEAELDSEGWAARSPWRLACTRPASAVALLEPLSLRFRITLAINLIVMALAVLLGWFVVQQTRRRVRLEALARESARVRELERQLFHAERLSTAGRLAAGIAHEINNPLEGMNNFLSLAREDLARGDGEAARRRLDRVAEGLQATAGIVRRVLAHADPSTGARRPVQLTSVLQQAVDLARSRREFQTVRVVHDDGGRPQTVRGSDVQLGQVFLNLILNACEVQNGSGEVVIRSARRGSSVTVEVADRGPGVPSEHRERIFEPFFSTKRSTGLGLSVCQSIVKQHEGTLSVRDREGGGAVFVVELPAWEATHD